MSEANNFPPQPPSGPTPHSAPNKGNSDSNRVLKIILIVAGVLLFLCLCCAGLGAAFFFIAESNVDGFSLVPTWPDPIATVRHAAMMWLV